MVNEDFSELEVEKSAATEPFPQRHLYDILGPRPCLVATLLAVYFQAVK